MICCAQALFWVACGHASHPRLKHFLDSSNAPRSAVIHRPKIVSTSSTVIANMPRHT